MFIKLSTILPSPTKLTVPHYVRSENIVSVLKCEKFEWQEGALVIANPPEYTWPFLPFVWAISYCVNGVLYTDYVYADLDDITELLQ